MLGYRWLEYHHRDRAPGAYEAIALLGPAGQSDDLRPTYLFDNFGGRRAFLTTILPDSTLILLRDTMETGARVERFTFRPHTAASFRFAWEVKRPGVEGWTIGDSLSCTRAAS